MQVPQAYPLDRYTLAIVFFLLAAIGTCYFGEGFGHGEESEGYHGEILPSEAISYLKEGSPVPLEDGAYALALPSSESYMRIEGREILPLFLLPISEGDGFVLYPINIADRSLIKKRGSMLVAHILLDFHSPHAENQLRYDEKREDGATPDRDYSRKAFYYLLVKDGYGEIQRGYLSKKELGDAIVWYRDPAHAAEELLAIQYFLLGYPPEIIKALAEQAAANLTPH